MVADVLQVDKLNATHFTCYYTQNKSFSSGINSQNIYICVMLHSHHKVSV